MSENVSAARREAIAFAVALARNVPNLAPARVAVLADRILRNARTAHVMADHDANRGLTPHERARVARLDRAARRAARELGMDLAVAGDPRGFVYWLTSEQSEGQSVPVPTS